MNLKKSLFNLIKSSAESYLIFDSEDDYDLRRQHVYIDFFRDDDRAVKLIADIIINSHKSEVKKIDDFINSTMQELNK